ncbi:TPA: DUF600 family protein [Streptococcus suis]|nr:DUF600 family protein [Streptococcus suis]HEM6099441.1 DUF600 family protein [Streptococcus suis]
MWEIFKSNGLEVWKNASLVYKDRKLHTNFDYVDWNASEFGPTDLLSFFRYRYVGIESRNCFSKKMEEFQKK